MLKCNHKNSPTHVQNDIRRKEFTFNPPPPISTNSFSLNKNLRIYKWLNVFHFTHFTGPESAVKSILMYVALVASSLHIRLMHAECWTRSALQTICNATNHAPGPRPLKSDFHWARRKFTLSAMNIKIGPVASYIYISEHSEAPSFNQSNKIRSHYIHIHICSVH